MKISRRDFLKFCGVSAAALGLTALDLARLREVLANPVGPAVIWLQGAGCTGCTESFLNRISSSPTEPQTAAEVLIDSINLSYHPTLMALAGESAAAQAERAFQAGNYILAVEGGVPTRFQGNTCMAWTIDGVEANFLEAVTALSTRAAAILCVGTCASWGGVAAAPPNPTAVKGVGDATGRPTINVAGCPPHPDWIVWTILQLLLGKTPVLDSYGRPRELFSKDLCGQCPRKGALDATTYGQDLLCLKNLGCRGEKVFGNCPSLGWNHGVNFCMEANAPCIGCTDPKFPFARLAARKAAQSTT
jgi:hydrogenase small subunit